MSYLHKDPTNGIAVFASKLTADETANLQAKIIALDTELDNENNNHWIPAKAAATARSIQAQADIAAAQAAADVEAERTANQEKALADGEITAADSNIARNNSWRTDLGNLTGYVNELINHRAE